MRCRMETIPGSGRRIRPRFRYTGRGLDTGRSTEVINWGRGTHRARGTLRVENYTGSRLGTATRARHSLTQVVEVMVILRRAQAPPPFHGLVAEGVGHAIDRE